MSRTIKSAGSNLVELRLELLDRLRDRHRLGGEQRPRCVLLLWEVDRQRRVDRVANDRGDRQPALPRHGLEPTVPRIVDQDLEPPIDTYIRMHVYVRSRTYSTPPPLSDRETAWIQIRSEPALVDSDSTVSACRCLRARGRAALPSAKSRAHWRTAARRVSVPRAPARGAPPRARRRRPFPARRRRPTAHPTHYRGAKLVRRDARGDERPARRNRSPRCAIARRQ